MIEVKKIGRFEGHDVLEVELQHGDQMVSIMNYGCVVRDWQLAGAAGVRHIVLGFDSFEPYPEYSPSFGIIAGRVANRTARGRFKLAGKEYQLVCNNGNNHLHGGAKGLGKCLWNMQADTATNAIMLEYRSVDNEQGYPGNVDFNITFSLDDHGLHCRMHGMPDRETPINLAQHNYYNLDGVGSSLGNIREHSLQLHADSYLPVDDELIPLGQIQEVQGSRFDFQKLRRIAEADPDQLGHDHNVVLAEPSAADDAAAEVAAGVAATLVSADSTVSLEMITDQRGIQLYTGKKLDVSVPGHQGARFRSFGGVCLEPQGFPDALNNPAWPSIMCSPEKPYKQNLTMRVKQQ